MIRAAKLNMHYHHATLEHSEFGYTRCILCRTHKKEMLVEFSCRSEAGVGEPGLLVECACSCARWFLACSLVPAAPAPKVRNTEAPGARSRIFRTETSTSGPAPSCTKVLQVEISLHTESR